MGAKDDCYFVLERINVPGVIILDKPDHTYTCGRAKENQIVCISLAVSRRHCIFFHRKNELYVTDLKSSNGVFINGVPQQPYQTTKLNPNDVIGVGCSGFDNMDETMFAYKLHLIAQPQIVVQSLAEPSLNHKTASSKCITNDKSDHAIKRKREQKNCDTNVVPNKIPKLLDRLESCSKEASLKEHSNAVDDNDLEIVHVSFNNNVLESDRLVNSMNSQLSNTSSGSKEKQNALSSCKDTDQSSKNTFQNVAKSMESNLLNNKNKENLANSRNCCNVQSEHRIGDTSTKAVSIENRNYDSKVNLKTSESEKTETLSPKVPSSFVITGDNAIKMEEELQLTDVDESIFWNSSNDVPLESPIKLKKIQHVPKTKFSEEDVVKLSDSEDDVFPCSQLFDIRFGMNASVKHEIKEEAVEIENERFSMLDDEDLIVSLSDSDDEDKNWLRRLSRSQTLNEDEFNREVKDDSIKKEDADVQIIDLEDLCSGSDMSADKSRSSINEKIKAEKETKEDKFAREKDEETSLQSTRSANEMDVTSTRLRKLEVESRDRVADTLNKSIDGNAINRESATCSEPAEKKNFSSSKHGIVGRDPLIGHSTESATVGLKKKSPEKRITQIEPLHLASRRRNAMGGTSKIIQASERPAKQKLSTIEKKELRDKAKIEEYMHAKEQKNRKVLNKWAGCLPPTKKKMVSPLTKEEKKALADSRKQRLKKLAMEEKQSSSESNREKKRIANKPKAKVSMKTRNDLLIEAALSAAKPEETKEKSKTCNDPTVANNSSSPKTLKDASKSTSKDLSTHLQNSLNLNSVGKIPKKSSVAKATANVPVQEALEDRTLARIMKDVLDISPKESEARNKSKPETTAPALPPQNRPLPTVTSTTSIKSPGKRLKKRVSFSAVIKTVREYQIEETNVLKKLVGKDAPLPTRVMKQVTETDKTNQFLLRIFSWNPVWLEEQQYLNTIAPVVADEELHVTLTHYKSYEEYYRIMAPLLLLEIWHGITKEFQAIDQNRRRPTLMCSIVENSIQMSMPSPNVSLTTLMLEVLVTREDLQKQAYPNYGDLVFFEYTRNQDKGQTFHKVFAYVNDVHQTVLTEWTHYNKELKNYVKKPHVLITYTMLTKALEPNVLVNRVKRMRSVTYLRSTLRLVQALEYLPKSPVMSLILSPKIEQYRLPNVSTSEQLITKDKLNPKQLEAVFKVTETIVQKQSKLCFIQGPPGTGKSKVIANIVSQVLYGNNRYTSSGSSLKILVCAPSNAAIDEITLRLLQIRSTISHKRFRMVRIGRSEVMHPVVKDISVAELAKRDMKKTTTNSMSIPLESVEEEKSLLESKMNALKCEIASTQKMDEAYKKYLRMKLADMATKYELLKNRRPLNEMNSKEFARIQRAAENRILAYADIITCTLSSCYNKQMESLFVTSKKGISVCIVDEATQSTEAESLIPLMLGVNTLVLVGDPNQLPATVISPQAKRFGLDQSIFSRVQNAFEFTPNNPIIMLDTQYRMPRDISSWPNKFFYAGKLKTAIPRNEEFPFHSYRIFNLNTSQNNDNFSNTDEAQFIANMIYSMLTYANLEKWESITFGILTPYNNQKTVIQHKINEKISSRPENFRKKMKFEVNTVDGFQGQERDVIIMSCVRSHKIGFLSDRQRLCVALTRAKHSLIICGNFGVFNKDIMWNSLLSDAKSRKIYFNVNARAEPQEIRQHVVKKPSF
nr:probable helicase senataxin isoform X1 [Nomia melanderi]